MGYTHYWYKVRELSHDDFDSFVRDFNKVLPNFRSLLDQSGDCPLEISKDFVYFNGIEEQAHETFHFERVIEKRDFEQFENNETKTHLFDFTKTAQKPYDIAVCSALIIAKKHFGSDIHISSDGDNDEWTESKALCQKILGYGNSLNMGNYSKDLEASGEFVTILTN